jgi:hypothetical protein
MEPELKGNQMNKLERKQLNERKENQRYTRDNMLWIGMATQTTGSPVKYNAKKEKALSYRTKDVDGWK